MGVKHPSLSVLDVITGDIPIAEAIFPSEQGEMLPAYSELAAAEKVLKDTGREFRLKEALEPIEADYDFIIIDAPPSLGILTVNALTAADKLIIPAQADDFSLQGITELYNSIRSIRRYTNPNLQIEGILLTRYNFRTVISRDMAEAMGDIADKIGGKLYKTFIRECTALKEAQSLQQDIFAYAPKSNAAEDYKNFVEEMLAVMEVKDVEV
jgi:chromosome partitioning protein